MYKLKESTETILVFDSCTEELEYSLKEQERSDRDGSTAPLQTHIGEISQEMPQGKNYQKIALISQSQQQSLSTSDQEEVDTRIALHCSESSNPVLVKAKDTDILILMVYTFAVTSPPHDWYLQINNGKIVSVEKIYQNFGITTSLCSYFSFILLLAAISSATSLEYQKHVFSNDC